MLSGMVLGQTIQKSSLLGLHLVTITLEPGVTMDQYLDFFVNKYTPEYEKVTEVQLFILRSVRGENINKLGILYQFESEEYRDKHFNEDDTLNDLGRSKMEKLQPIRDKLKKLGSSERIEFDDWLVL